MGERGVRTGPKLGKVSIELVLHNPFCPETERKARKSIGIPYLTASDLHDVSELQARKVQPRNGSLPDSSDPSAHVKVYYVHKHVLNEVTSQYQAQNVVICLVFHGTVT